MTGHEIGRAIVYGLIGVVTVLIGMMAIGWFWPDLPAPPDTRPF